MEISEKQLQSLITQAISAAIAASKAPTEAELAKQAQDQADLNKKMQMMVDEARLEEESKKRLWASCPHLKPNGKRSTGGQIHSDGLYHEVCLRCQFEFPPVRPSQDMIATGVQL